MKHREVGEVGDASNRFEGVESGECTIFPGEDCVKDSALEESNGETIGIFDRFAEGGAKFGGGIIVGAFVVGRSTAGEEMGRGGAFAVDQRGYRGPGKGGGGKAVGCGKNRKNEERRCTIARRHG